MKTNTAKNPTKKKPPLAKQTIEIVLNYSDEELANAKVARLAELLGCNRSHLSRIFKEQTGSSLEEYILRVKMLRAEKLLLKDRENKLTVTEISERMGFCRLDYFIKVFRNFFGLSPAAYRDFHWKKNGD